LEARESSSLVVEKEVVLDEHWVKEVPVAERIRLDASLFPLHLVKLVDSLLQISFRRERQQKIWWGSKLLKFCELRWIESLCSRV
jgi:hypothetical protein